MIVGTKAYVTVTRFNIAAGWLKGQSNQPYTLQMVSGEAILILKEVFLALTLGWHSLKIWVFFVNFTKEFILGLDVLHRYASVALGRQTLSLAEE
jgi:hypothetical protein